MGEHANQSVPAAQASRPERSASLVAVLGRGLVDPAEPIARADDAGLTRGDGCFEGIRVRTDSSGHSSVDKLDRHLARMARSALALDIPFDAAGWTDLIEQACAAWTDPAPGEASMKLVLTRGSSALGAPTGFLTITALDPDYLRQRRDGIAVITVERGLSSDAFVSAPWLLGGVKTLSYAVNMAAHRTALQHGASDVLFVSSDGYVLEAPTATAVWADGRRLRTTPTGATGILAGTTQALLFDNAATAGWQTETALVHVDELHAADALWVVSSIRGPIEVVELDGKTRTRNPELDAEIKQLCGFG